MIQINIVDREGVEHTLEAPTDMHMNIMELCKAYEFPVKGTCGGMAMCSTCHVYVLSDTPLPEMGAEEEEMLDQAFFVDARSRLGCQLMINEAMDGLQLPLAPESD